MRAIDSTITWNVDPPRVAIVPYGRETRQSTRNAYSDGACYTDWQEATPKKRMIWLMELFRALTIIYHIPPKDVDQEFMKIDEYRKRFEKYHPVRSN